MRVDKNILSLYLYFNCSMISINKKIEFSYQITPILDYLIPLYSI